MARLARICTPFQLVDAVDMHVESHTRTHTRSRMHFTSSLHAHTHTCSRMRSHTCSQTRDMPGLPSSSSAEPLSLSLLVTGTGVDGARGCEGVSDCGDIPSNPLWAPPSDPPDTGLSACPTPPVPGVDPLTIPMSFTLAEPGLSAVAGKGAALCL